jgi:hypothetical protein
MSWVTSLRLWFLVLEDKWTRGLVVCVSSITLGFGVARTNFLGLPELRGWEDRWDPAPALDSSIRASWSQGQQMETKEAVFSSH